MPKRPVAEATITPAGVAGDRQRNRRLHGGPRRAVCLYSAEMIEQLRAEGHPIAPGSTGENLTLRGIDWALIRPGVRLRLGNDAELEVTAFTAPCATIGGSFAGGDSSRIAASLYPGQSRVYARVTLSGLIRAGDPVRIA